MALFSIRNERDLVVLNGLASEVTAATFAASASAGEGQLLNQYGVAPTGKEKFAIYMKHLDGRVRKSDVIDPFKLIDFKKQIPVTEVLPSATATIGAATAGDLYEITIRIWNDGSLSRDNVIFLNASYTAAASGDTTTTIATALVAALNAAQTRMGQDYFTISNSGTAVITLQSKRLPFVTGKKDGRAIDFAVQARQVNPTTLVLGTIAVVYTEFVPNPAAVNFIKDLEWQTHGAFGDSLRGLAYPHDFAIYTDVVDTTVYTIYEFSFYDGDQHNHAVQQSPRHLTVAVPAANVAAFDALVETVLDLSGSV